MEVDSYAYLNVGIGWCGEDDSVDMLCRCTVFCKMSPCQEGCKWHIAPILFSQDVTRNDHYFACGIRSNYTNYYYCSIKLIFSRGIALSFLSSELWEKCIVIVIVIVIASLVIVIVIVIVAFIWVIVIVESEVIVIVSNVIDPSPAGG